MDAMRGGATARPATLADLDAVLGIVRASETAAIGTPLTSREDIEGDWLRPGMDLSRDTLVVEVEGRLVAQAEQYAGRAFTHVHPDARGQGIGSAIAAWVESQAAQAGLERVGQTIPDEALDAQELLKGRGWQPRWTSWILERDLEVDPPQAPRSFEGIEIRPLRVGQEDRELYATIDRAFNDWVDRGPSLPFEDWRVSFLDRALARPELVLVASDGTSIVGGAICIVEGETGWVDQLAVAHEHRGRGLGGALLAAAFGAFQRLGLTRAALSTDSRTGALDLYLHVGMHVTRSFTRWSHDVP